VFHSGGARHPVANLLSVACRVKIEWVDAHLARYNRPMQFDLEVTPIRPAAAKSQTFEGVSLDLTQDQYVAEESSLLDAIIAALRPLTTLVRSHTDER